MQRHPWETSRARFFIATLARRQLDAPARRVLDVGSGDAWFARQLVERSAGGQRLNVTCWDRAYSPDDLARLRAEAPASGPAAALAHCSERPAGRFDVILCLDVLEHVEDDRALLRSLVEENLADSGHVLVSVPAWPQLFSAHDAFLGHHRRYRPREGRALVADCGLALLESGGLFHSLLPVRALQQLAQKAGLQRNSAHIGQWAGGPGLTAFVEAALGVDQAATRVFSRLRVEVPGLTWWALCLKRR